MHSMNTQIKPAKDDLRTPEQISEHYTLEKELAAQLRNASKTDRAHLYTHLYDQLFQKIPHHPQHTRKQDAQASQQEIDRKMNLVARYLQPDTQYLEVGPGDCQFAFAVAPRVKKVYAVDVSSEITKNPDLPTNFELILSDGCTVPVPENSISVAYSNQLMEHLHPDDSYEQLGELHRALQPGGVYICITPNRLAGPHDVSKYFDPVATGFHLQEYTNQELHQLFRKIGFSKIITYMGGKGTYVRCPYLLAVLVESFLKLLPFKLRYSVANWLPIRAILGVILVAQK
jgi:ubiquinone/menaquinone biosynthesis C-methylase UbiE